MSKRKDISLAGLAQCQQEEIAAFSDWIRAERDATDASLALEAAQQKFEERKELRAIARDNLAQALFELDERLKLRVQWTDREEKKQ